MKRYEAASNTYLLRSAFYNSAFRDLLLQKAHASSVDVPGSGGLSQNLAACFSLNIDPLLLTAIQAAEVVGKALIWNTQLGDMPRGI